MPEQIEVGQVEGDVLRRTVGMRKNTDSTVPGSVGRWSARLRKQPCPVGVGGLTVAQYYQKIINNGSL